MTSREQFEAWATHINTSRDCLSESGYWPQAQTAWEAWQASREALVIELPGRARGTTLDLPGSEGENDYLLPEARVRQAIQAAGVKVKP